MRLTIVLLVASLVQVSAAGYGQKITIVKNNISLTEVFKEIRKQSGYNILWQPDKVDDSKKLNLKLKAQELEQVLDEVLKGQHLVYSIEDQTIRIKYQAPSFLEKLAAAWRNADVHCRVEDEKGEPLAGASVRVKGTNKAVVTDDKGEFTIKQLEENTVLVISYLGYKTKEILAKEVSGSSAIQLEPAAG
ncbi:STN domain-containing protein, partial [Pedobacter nutrimenti]